MDEARNPFDSALQRDSESLVGRERELTAIEAMFEQLGAGAPSAPVMFSGRTGVGTSALALAVAARAVPHDWHCGFVSPGSDEPLRDTIARGFALALCGLAARRPGAAAVRLVADAVAGFCPSVVGELPAPVAPDAVDVARGDLTRDLRRLLAHVGDGLRDLVGRGLVVVVDELHRADAVEATAVLRAFAEAMRDGQPVGLVVSGTPTIRWLAATAEASAGVIDLAPLGAADVGTLVLGLVRDLGVDVDPDALAAMVRATAGYPALVLLYAHTAWNVAVGTTVTAADVAAGAPATRDRLARTVLAPAFAVNPAARRYLRAVAEADDPASSVLIARRLGDTTRFGSGVSQLTQLRDELVRLGLLTNIDGDLLTFAHPAARSYVLSWE